MWMMGYNDGGELNVPESFNGRKLRPLIPRPITSLTTNSSASTPPANSNHRTDFLTSYQPLPGVTEQSKRELSAQPVVVSSRWNPTPEQLRSLEELYRRGTRTPTADQIQHITSQLRRYGKIEGKNVFYWFQNHKARERQKRRRQMESIADDTPQRDVEILERKDPGAGRTGYEVGQMIKNWAPPTNCSTTLAEESVSIQRLAAAKAAVAGSGTDGWIQVDGGDFQFQQRKNFVDQRNATWQMLQLPCPASPNQLINTSCSTNTAAVRRTTDQKFISTHDHLDIFMAPCTENGLAHHIHSACNEGDGCGESETLQLFPLRSSNGDGDDDIEGKEPGISVSNVNSHNLTPYQFFEFLPLKK